jgi:hypothetical protein
LGHKARSSGNEFLDTEDGTDVPVVGRINKDPSGSEHDCGSQVLVVNVIVRHNDEVTSLLIKKFKISFDASSVVDIGRTGSVPT